MCSRNEKYRNPPAPLGYIRTASPELKFKDSSDISDIDEVIQLIIDSGICDEPDPSIYEHFKINTSSEEEDIVEVPVKRVPVEVIDIDVEPPAVIEDAVAVTVKNEADSPKCEDKTEVSKDSELEPEQSAAVSTVPQNLVTGESLSEKEKKRHKKKADPDSSSKHRRKKRKHRKKDYKSDSDSSDNSHYRREGGKRHADNEARSGAKSYGRRHTDDEDSGSESTYPARSYRKRHSSEEEPNCDDYARIKNRRPKRDQIKSKREPSYSTDDDDSNDYPVRTISPSSSKRLKEEEERTLAGIKKEVGGGPLLHGVYHCDVCNISVNSESTYQSHINGKKHKKAVEASSGPGCTSASTVSVLDRNYPKPPPGYYRMKMDTTAVLQTFIDENLFAPCPGLENVFEIHGYLEISYYCQLCDSTCSSNNILPHLKGFKHQLNTLKLFKRDLYEKWTFEARAVIGDRLLKELRIIENRRGRGCLTVEKDFPERSNVHAFNRPPSMKAMDLPSTSQFSLDASFTENYEMHSIPDPSKPGFYCRLCDSHSNSEAMWRNHITGKRHLANVRKVPGAPPSKTKYIPAAPSVRPYLFELLEKENPDHLPVVGLGQIREIRKPDIDGVTYNCFLCSACTTTLDIVNHILSKKHREKYLDSLQHPELMTLRNCHITEASMESIIADICSKVEAERGSGIPEVYYAKNAVRRN